MLGFKSTRGLGLGACLAPHTQLETSDQLMPASCPRLSLRGQTGSDEAFDNSAECHLTPSASARTWKR